VVCLIGSASAYIKSRTEITEDMFTSTSRTSVSNYPMTQQYESPYIAKLKYAAHPAIDPSWIETQVSGDVYTQGNEVKSTPSGTTTSTTITNPSRVRCGANFFN